MISILYPLKTPENLWFSGIFRGYKIGILARNGLNTYLYGAQYSRMDQVKFVENSLQKIWRGMVCFKQTISLQIF